MNCPPYGEGIFMSVFVRFMRIYQDMLGQKIICGEVL